METNNWKTYRRKYENYVENIEICAFLTSKMTILYQETRIVEFKVRIATILGSATLYKKRVEVSECFAFPLSHAMT